MTLPRFSVIIPTRERHDTLEGALRTCTTQNFDSAEIVVSDNFSQDATAEVVHSFRDPRIRYFNTQRRLGMSGNWEFALAQARGEFIIFIGDDDGLLPGALGELDALLNSSTLPAVAWRSAAYYWPSFPDPLRRNLLSVHHNSQTVERHAPSMLADVIRFRRSYDQLPGLYRGCVARRLVDRIADGGRVFHSMTPDIYSAVALACVADRYLFSYYPFAISGVSGHSTGASSFTPGASRAPEQKFYSEENIPFHPMVALGPSLPFVVAEAFLQAREHVRPQPSIRLDIDDLLSAALDQTTELADAQYALVEQAVLETGRRNDRESAAIKLISRRRAEPRPVVPRAEQVPGVDILRGYTLLNCEELGVRNVYEASLLCKMTMSASSAGYYSPRGVIKTTLGLMRRALRQRIKQFVRMVVGS